MFLDAPGSTGKTYLINLILSKIRSQGKIVLATASSGIAAILLQSGRTLHVTFKIPLDTHRIDQPTCRWLVIHPWPKLSVIQLLSSWTRHPWHTSLHLRQSTGPYRTSRVSRYFRRFQFLIRSCFAMTINKSQGQTFKAISVDLSSACLTHEMSYVAVSRLGTSRKLYILAPNERTRNVVYPEALTESSLCYL